MIKYQFSADLRVVGRWAFQPPGCPIVIEANNHGLSILKALRALEANILKSSTRNPQTGAIVEAFGHRTTEANRPEVIEKLDKAFRTVAPVVNELDEENIDPEALEIYDEHALEECGTFMIDKKGKAQASGGNHDDDVMGLAIGYFYIGSATAYTERIVQKAIPKWDYEIASDPKKRVSITGS